VSHLGTPWGILSADAKVATEAPFNLSGQLHFNGAIEQQTFAVNSQLNGTLANINISADAQGSELIAGHVTAEVQPFQTMPLQH
ncbi:hypothetical protein ACN4FY_11790, partial [Aliarcobacter butzleri]|uniref:hypothetical protein n=1 Tax=Aliarcobacter butzleri TaxID=28197 RepID=UPI003AF5A04B